MTLAWKNLQKKMDQKEAFGTDFKYFLKGDFISQSPGIRVYGNLWVQFSCCWMMACPVYEPGSGSLMKKSVHSSPPLRVRLLTFFL